MTINMKESIKGITLTKACRFKVDKESELVKNVNLEFSFEGVILEEVFTKAVSSAVIQWQNGPGRAHFNSWKNGQTVKIQFKAPGVRPVVDPITAILNAAKDEGISVEEYVVREAKKRVS